MIKKIYYKLIGFRNRPNYWSHSKFADQMRILFNIEPIPAAETSKGWKEYKNRNRHKKGYWLIEEGLDFAQDFVMFIPDVFTNFKYKINSIFIDRYWMIDTKLAKHEYHEFDTRLLHGMFEMLVDFVEIEKAHMNGLFDTPYKKPKLPSRELGLHYLDWEISLAESEVNASKRQSEVAELTKHLYLWWKDKRPNRVDPYDAYPSSKTNEKDLDIDDLLNDHDHERWFKIEQLRQQYHDEDTEKLIQLIKIRQDLWT